METVWLEMWWGFELFGFRFGSWRKTTASGYGTNALAIEREKTTLLRAMGLEEKDVDGKDFRWRVSRPRRKTQVLLSNRWV